MIFSYPENSAFARRVKNFLAFKGIPYTPNIQKKNDSPEIFSRNDTLSVDFGNGKISTSSLTILRDIEEFSPYPIGFIGPIESIFQWASMAVSAYSELTPEILEPVFEEISEKVEDEYFLMGPTFSVADCVLAADLSVVGENFLLPKTIKEYIGRVHKACNANL